MLQLTPLEVFSEGNRLPRNEEFGISRIRNTQKVCKTENALWYIYYTRLGKAYEKRSIKF
jgi:hypothetical protein